MGILDSCSVLNDAFVTTTKQSKKKTEGNGKQEPKDIRAMSYADRQMLLKGPRVHIIIQGEVFITTYLPLLRHSSTKVNELVSSSEIHLPDGTDRAGVIRLIEHLHWIINTRQRPASRMAASRLPLFDLSTCAAAWLLGMERYTNHVYNYYVARMANDIPEYVEVTAVQRFEVEHPHLYSVMTKHLAYLVRSELIPDPEEFQLYLTEHPRLAQAINNINEAHEHYEKEKKERVKRQAKAKEAQARREAAKQERHEKQIARQKQDKARWEMKEKRDQELGKSVREKLQFRMPFTAEEKRHYVSIYGKQPPRGF